MALLVLATLTVGAPGSATTVAPGRAATVTTSRAPTVTTSRAPTVTTSRAPTVDGLKDELEDTEQAIDEAEEDLESTRREIADVTAKVRESAALVASYEAQLVDLEDRLAAARTAATDAAVRSEQARAELQLVDSRLLGTEVRLDRQEAQLQQRAASAFMYGDVTVVDAASGARSVSDFVTATYYVRRIIGDDIDLVGEVDVLRGALVDERTRSDRLREEEQQHQLAAEAARVELEDLTAAQARLTRLAGEERARRTRLLRRLQFHEASTEAQLVELAEESDALEEQLRKAQWRAGAPGDGSWVWPTDGRLTSSFGYRTHPIWGGQRLHAGVDVGAGTGTPIVAANTGKVLTARCSSGGYGCRVVIDHGGGFATLYAHQSRFAVGEGDIVTAGQRIGSVGSTGASTGPHLHFEVRKNGAPVDPMRFYGE